MFFCFLTTDAAAQIDARGRLAVSANAILPGETVTVGFRISLPDGWHVYWKNPGDAGEPTVLTLSLPEGFRDLGRRWPTPEIFKVSTLTQYGYRRTAWLFADVLVPTTLPDGLVEISGKADFLACKDECIPMSLSDTVLLGTGKGKTNGEVLSEINDLPNEGEAFYQETPDGFVLSSDLPDGADKAYFFSEQPDVVAYSSPQNLKKKDGQAYLFLKKSEYFEKTNGLAGELVFYDGFGKKISSKNISASLSGKPFPVDDPFSVFDFCSALLFALFGGFLLNLMPCVFPVLSLKAFALLKRKENAADNRREAVLYTAGVLTSFVIVGTIMSGLRATGTEMGWGFQMQYPPFVAGLSLFLFFSGLLFSDVVTVGEKWAAIGNGRFVSPFGTGVLAVLAATPCAAPFMGVALGYALTQPLSITTAVMLSMGFGLAFPFLILGFCPSAGRFLPKAGPWLNDFRHFLAFPLYAASAWLLWVLSVQAGEAVLAKVLTGMIAIAFSCWLSGGTSVRPVLKKTAAFLSVLIAVWAVLPVREGRKIEWIPYDAETVSSFRAQGNPVFIKFSARWCLTCLLNDKTAFAAAETVKAFEDNAVAAFYGDWTNGGADIGAAIESFGRNSVPLYVYYPPKSEKPVILPQVLTSGGVIAALSRRSPE